jgi:hypothetical protein
LRSGYKHNLEVSSRALSSVSNLRGYPADRLHLGASVVVIYGLVALRGRRAFPPPRRRREVRLLEEQNAAQAAENERAERIHRLKELN